jgi:hypothetical protein
MADRRVGDLLTAPKGLQLLDLISQCQAADLTDNDLSGLLPQLDFHVTRYRGDYEPTVEALKSRAPQLGRLAQWLPGRMAHWWDDLDRKNQSTLQLCRPRSESAIDSVVARVVADICYGSLRPDDRATGRSLHPR